jgi:aryl-alcohol dehydrogenase-like predicted oxidoreductase
MRCRWDFNTSVEDVMNGLNNLVQQGKVLYLVVFSVFLWFSIYIAHVHIYRVFQALPLG